MPKKGNNPSLKREAFQLKCKIRSVVDRGSQMRAEQRKQLARVREAQERRNTRSRPRVLTGKLTSLLTERLHWEHFRELRQIELQQGMLFRHRSSSSPPLPALPPPVIKPLDGAFPALEPTSLLNLSFGVFLRYIEAYLACEGGFDFSSYAFSSLPPSFCSRASCLLSEAGRMDDRLIDVLTACTDVERFAAWGTGVTDDGLMHMRPRLSRFEEEEDGAHGEGWGDEEWERGGDVQLRGFNIIRDLEICDTEGVSIQGVLDLLESTFHKTLERLSLRNAVGRHQDNETDLLPLLSKRLADLCNFHKLRTIDLRDAWLPEDFASELEKRVPPDVHVLQFLT